MWIFSKTQVFCEIHFPPHICIFLGAGNSRTSLRLFVKKIFLRSRRAYSDYTKTPKSQNPYECHVYYTKVGCDALYASTQSCFSCAAGKTSLEPGKECRECPYEHVLKNKTCHPCVDIPPGKTLKRFAEVCSELMCKQGQSTYTTDCVVEFEEEGARNCRQDGFGWNHLQLNSCDVCSVNFQSIRIQADASSSFNVCVECGHNLFTRDTGMSACIRCPLYHTRQKGSPACDLCVAGMFLIFFCSVCLAHKYVLTFVLCDAKHQQHSHIKC